MDLRLDPFYKRVLPAVVAFLLAISTAEASWGALKGCRELVEGTWLAFLFPSPPSNALEQLKLPPVLKIKTPEMFTPARHGYYQSAKALFEKNAPGLIHREDLRSLAGEVLNQAQYLVYEQLVRWDATKGHPLARRIRQFRFTEQAIPIAYFRRTGIDYTNADIDHFLRIKTNLQVDFFIALQRTRDSEIDLDFAYEVILPRISNEFQSLALEHILEYDRGRSRGLLRLGLNITSQIQLELLEFLLDHNAVDAAFEKVLKVVEWEDGQAIRRAFLEKPNRLPEPAEAPYKNADGLVLHEFGVVRWAENGHWHSLYQAVRLELEGNMFQHYRGKPGVDLMRDRTGFQRRELRDNKSYARRRSKFYRNVYLQLNDGKYNGVAREKFDQDWINLLFDEDRHLPQERMMFFEFLDFSRQTLAFFGLFDGSHYFGEPHVLIPALQKRPHIEKSLMQKIAQARGGKYPRHIFEWRRLAIRRGTKDAPQDKVHLAEVEKALLTHLRHYGFRDAVVIGHTDSFGLKIFSEKTHLKPIMSAEEIGQPDEHILWMDVDSIP